MQVRTGLLRIKPLPACAHPCAARARVCSGIIEAPPGLESPLRCESPSDTLKALWLSERLGSRKPQAHPPAAARCGSHGAGCRARRKSGGAHVRRSAPCHILSADPWASDDSPGPPTGSGSDRGAEYESMPSVPLVSLSPAIRGAASASPGRPAAAPAPALASRTARCDAAVRLPGVRWSCPALMVYCASPCSRRRLGSGTARHPALLRLAGTIGWRCRLAPSMLRRVSGERPCRLAAELLSTLCLVGQGMVGQGLGRGYYPLSLRSRLGQSRRF